MLRLSLAALHLIALGIGLGAIWSRGRSLGERPLDLRAVRQAFVADTWWGIAAILWIATGLWRLLAGTEKATNYYFHNVAFVAKMGLLVVILALEVWPMTTLIRWRVQVGRAGDSWTPNEHAASVIRTISYVQAVLIVAMVIAAVTMARGFGYRPAL